MINFCLTNKPKLVKGNWKSKKRLKQGVWLYYDSGVEIINSPKHWIVFGGILWEGQVTDFLKDTKQNGIFYAIVLNKISGEVQVINDFSDSFYLNYYMSGRHFVVTNEIKVYGPSFKINQYWVNWSKQGVDLYQAPSPKKENITPLEGVKYLGAGDVLTFQAWDDFDCRPIVTNWFTYHRDVGPLFDAKPLHNHESALDTTKKIIAKNCQLIQEKYGTRLVHFCSTGVDSLTIKSNLNDVPMYGFIGTGFNKYHELEAPFKQLYNDYNGTLHYFDIKTLEDVLNSQLPNLQKTIKYDVAHLMLMYIRDVYHLNDRVIVHSNFGDHVLWHNRRYVLFLAVHRWGMKDAQQIWDRCIPHYGFGGPAGPTGVYSKQSRIDEINKYLSDPYPDFKTAVIAHKYFIKPPNLSNLSDPLCIDPYMDLRLINLLPSCDIPTQEASILDARIQKDMISDELLPYLNPHKAGGNWVYDFPKRDKEEFRKKMLSGILKNLQRI